MCPSGNDYQFSPTETQQYLPKLISLHSTKAEEMLDEVGATYSRSVVVLR